MQKLPLIVKTYLKFLLLDTIKMQRRWSRDLGTQHLSVSSLEKKTELKRIFSELQIAINYIVILTFSTFWSYSLLIVLWIVLSSFPCITIIQLIIIFSFFCSCSHLTQLFSFNCFQMSVYFFKPFLVILLILSSSHSPIGQVLSVPIANFPTALPAHFKLFLEASAPQTCE